MKKPQLSRNTKVDIEQTINTKNPNDCAWKKRNASEAKDPRGKPSHCNFEKAQGLDKVTIIIISDIN